jgi:hypothetical protein
VEIGQCQGGPKDLRSGAWKALTKEKRYTGETRSCRFPFPRDNGGAKTVSWEN